MTAPAERVLLVEDDGSLAALIVDFLSQHNLDVSVEPRGDTAVDRILAESPDVVVLDVNLPGLDGFSVCKAVRQQFHGVILMLTARGEEIDEVLGLELGADDYLAKPVRPRALLARLRMHLRRSAPESCGKPISIGALLVDDARRAVELDGNPIELTTAEFDLLHLLARNAGRTLSRGDIYRQLHGIDHDSQDRSIDLRISRLRKKLGDDSGNPQRIKSIRGVGYLLSLES